MAREKAVEERHITRAEATKIRVTFFAYTVSDTPRYDFHEGDVFHGTHDVLQISVIRDAIEVCRFVPPRYVYACHVTEGQFAEWLRSGIEPTGSRINKHATWAEWTKYFLFE